MSNKWIDHIRKWAKDNNSTYACALSNPKCKEDYHKTSKQHSTKQVKEKQKSVKDESTFDSLSYDLQHLIYITPLNDIRKALMSLNFKGSMQTNKVLLNLQLLQNFNTSEKIEQLINALKKK
jgi:hypothetical protein